jgi:hypothetical protein
LEGLRFADADAARAAFALGDVAYRCAWCGRVHRAGEGRECLRSYARACRCWRKIGPLPPMPHLSPAFYFAVVAWLRHRPALSGDDEVVPGEWVLALEPTAAGLREAVEGRPGGRRQGTRWTCTGSSTRRGGAGCGGWPPPGLPPGW